MTVDKTNYTFMATKNDCYITGTKIVPTHIVIHDTSANNPELRRYVQPVPRTANSVLGTNQYNNDWCNNSRPDGERKCAHAFVGKLANGSVAFAQILPYNINGWHAGGPINSYSIGIELCYDGANSKDYFNDIINLLTYKVAQLCKDYNIKPENILGHYEAHDKGLASNHGDPKAWFAKFGYNMSHFRADVAAVLKVTPKPSNPNVKELYRVRKSWGNVSSQKGAFNILDNAIKCAKQTGYNVYNSKGAKVYQGSNGAK